jgi:hypothetical protein
VLEASDRRTDERNIRESTVVISQFSIVILKYRPFPPHFVFMLSLTLTFFWNITEVYITEMLLRDHFVRFLLPKYNSQKDLRGR